MPFYTVLLIWMISQSHAVYPNGTYKGEVTNPYLYIDFTFHDPPGAYVNMEVTCNATKRPASSTVGIEADPDFEESVFHVTEDDLEDIEMMINDLNTICPERSYSTDDFTMFIEVDEGTSYNVVVERELIKIQKQSQTI
ncbi:hypothetical protein FOL47_001467 [Perkinsus chesapeaki]|uniref:Uncharacterized protein n=1 Tax=Perkinsus chesapeaki TaxID=330153 RepID=A0A7J6MJ23_PERCH|nr:hypothetical protein FOL47_001467 [Perkinsus chesapeaki]